MFLLAFKNLFQERLKLLISIGGIATAIILILLLEGILAGQEQQIVAYIDKSKAQVWVMQEGVSNMHMANSLIPRGLKKEISEIEGVDDVAGILYVSSLLEIENKKTFSYVVGFDPKSEIGGPWKMASGSRRIEEDEIILSDVIARKRNLKIGDRIELMGQMFTVAGLSKETFSMANTVTFLNQGALARLLRAKNSMSYFLVSVGDSNQAEEVVARIKKEIPGVNALSTEEFVRSDRKMVKQMGIDIINAMSFVGFVIGIMVVALTIYTATLEKIREYGVLKAVGANLRQLYQIVFQQAVLSALLGFVTGAILSFGLGFLIEALFPELLVVFEGNVLLKAFLAMIGASFVASYIPIRRIARIDPTIVFKA